MARPHPARVLFGQVRFMFRALESRNYRLFFIGQGTSLIGTWMQTVAIGWLVYRLTNSEFLLGLVGFAGQIPNLLLMPIAGVFADVFDRRRILLVTQNLALLQATVLAALTMTQVISFGPIIALALFLGIVNAFDMPTRQSFVIDMVEKRENLPNGIALNSLLFNSARLVGPSIAGVVIAAAGEGLCFLLNAVSYLAAIVALALMRLARRFSSLGSTSVLGELRAGARYAFGSRPIRTILIFIAFVNLVGMSFMVLMPVVARDILHGGPRTLGLLTAATGVGALAGAVRLASRRSVLGLGRMIGIAALLFGAALLGLGLSRTIWLSTPVMVVLGFGMMTQMASCNTMVQTIVDDERRGRVMSFFSLSFMGAAPFGALLLGAVARAVGVPVTLAIGGALCLGAGLLFLRQLPALRAAVRPIYQDKGLIP